MQEKNLARKDKCAEVGLKLGEKNRAHLKDVGQDKTDIYEDEYIYSKKLKTCLYYKKQFPIVYDAQNYVGLLTKEILDASTNKKVVSFIKMLNSETVEDEMVRNKMAQGSCTSSEEWSCKTEDDFNKIKEELFEN